MKNYSFFDNASTTRCSEAAVKAFSRYSLEDYGNPSSSHAMGRKAAAAVKEAKDFFAGLFNIESNQVIFTSSGSEANNLALQGFLNNLSITTKTAGRRLSVVYSATEHPSVSNTVKALQSPEIETRLLPVDSDGQPINFDSSIDQTTVLATTHLVNNITGAILSTETLAASLKRIVPSAVFHCDCVQAFGKIELPSAPSNIDMLSISAHKIHGPKGIGALIILNKKLLAERKLRPLIFGGNQEEGIRSGTQSTGLIAAFHSAAKDAVSQTDETRRHTAKLKNLLLSSLRDKGLLDASSTEGTVVCNSPKMASSHICNISVPGIPSGALARYLEEKGFIVATGSACDSKRTEPDAVLMAMGLSKDRSLSAIRVSFSKENTPEEVRALSDAIIDSQKALSRLTKGAR